MRKELLKLLIFNWEKDWAIKFVILDILDLVRIFLLV